ncbi:MAG: hypothetical protein LBF88_06345 [Planctomycetaceae bacterium]|nr:hypothetical protein [Planctomycetaceae bacterium]
MIFLNLYYLALFPYSLSIPDISELLRDGFDEAVACMRQVRRSLFG